MTDKRDPDDDFQRIIEGNDWNDIPLDHQDQDPWAEDIPWEPATQPEDDLPEELDETTEDESYSPDPGGIIQGVSPGMVRAFTVIAAVLALMVGLAMLPGPLPAVAWGAGVAGLIGGLYLVFRALPEDSSGDDGAVL